jgi:ABC-type arginine transport system permease subunit
MVSSQLHAKQYVFGIPTPCLFFLVMFIFFGSNKVIMTLTNEMVILNRNATAFFTGWIGIGLCLMKLTQSNLLKLKVPKQLID